jgi:di/tricarboxylate transporter
MLSRPGLQGGAILAAGLAAAAALHATGAPPEVAWTCGLIIFVMGFWGFGVLHEALTGLAFMLGAVMLAGLPPTTAFGGFTTSAFWLVFAGAVLSAAASRTGLSAWLADRLLRPRMAAESYGARVAAVVVFAVGLALILPSTLARVAILVPLVMALAERLGYAAGSRGANGLVLAAAIGTFVVPITILPANLPNIVLAGSLEALYGMAPGFGAYMLLHFPVIGLVKGAALVVIITRLHAEPPTGTPAAEDGTRLTLNPVGRRLGVVLALTLGLWVTDTLHGLPIAWVGLAAALLCLMPAMRIIGLGDLPSASLLPTFVYIGAVLGLGAVLTESGAGAVLSRALVERLPLAGASDFATLSMLAGLATLTGLVATMPAAPAVTAPFFGEIAATAGWSVKAVGMSQVLGYATPLLPYQVPPLMVALAMAGMPMREATRILLILAATTTPVVLPAAHWWWQVLGWY